MATAREAAYSVLLEVESGSYAADAVIRASAFLSPRDARLAQFVVLGVLRLRAQLDCIIQQVTGRPASKLDVEVLTALRMGVFQLRHAERIPPHAAVNDSVELVKRARKRSAVGLVNAVLRKVTPGEIPWPDEATALSCPAWLLHRWTAGFGEPVSQAIARAALDAPPRYIRVPRGAAPPDDAEPTGVNGCFVSPSAAPPFRVQDISSQSVVPLLALAPGQRYLDLCAAPGNKTAQALETPLRAIACDISPSRLLTLRPLDIPLVRLDGEKPLPFPAVFDRILVDAPCSGTGTLAHNPEIKWRLTPGEIERQAARQKRILENALAALAPAGLLVYSTCSLEPEENEEVVQAVAPGLIRHTMRRMPGRDPGDGFFAAVLSRAP